MRTWSTSTGALLHTFTGHTWYVFGVAISPDGTRIASCSYDNTVKIWDASSGRLIRTIGTGGIGLSIAFSPDGSRVAVSVFHRVAIYNVATGALLGGVTGEQSTVTCVKYSPDGSRIAAVDANKVKVWNVASQTLTLTLTTSNNQNSFKSVAFSPDGRKVATGSTENLTQTWDATTGALLRTLPGGGFVAYSPDGSRLASSWSGQVKVWNEATGTSIVTMPGGEGIAYSPNGQRLAIAFSPGIRLTDASTGELIRGYGDHGKSVNSVDFSIDGTRIVSASGDGTCKVWDSSSGGPVGTLAGHTNGVTSVRMSPDGKLIASGSEDKSIRIWDARTGTLIRILLGHTDSINSVDVSPDSKRIASGSRDNTVRIWDVNGTLQRTFSAGTLYNPFNPLSVRFSPDGTMVACGGSDGQVRLWNIAAATLERTFPVGASAVCFSPDGTWLATASGTTISVWNVVTGTLIRRWTEGTYRLSALTVSPDGNRIASGTTVPTPSYASSTIPSEDTIKVREASTGNIIESFSTGSSVLGLRYSPNGKALAVAGELVRGVIGDPVEDDPTGFRVFGANPGVLTRRTGASLRVFGSGFQSGVTVKLERVGSASIPTKSMVYRSSFLLETTIDSSGATLGKWDVVVTNPNGSTARLAEAVEIVGGTGLPSLTGSLAVPSEMRPGRTNTITASWGNTGSGPTSAPILLIEATDASGARLGLPMRTSAAKPWSSGAVMLVGSGFGGDPGVLEPGAFNSATIQFQSPNTPGTIRWRFSKVNSLNPSVYADNWATLSDATRPAGVDNGAWNKVWSSFTGRIGADDQSLFTAIRGQAAYTNSVGSPATEIGELLSIPLAHATGEMAPAGVIEEVTDLGAPTPGLSLEFSRTMSVLMLDRKAKGLFGLGWRHSFDTHLNFPAGNRIEVVTPDGRTTLYSRDNLGVWSGGEPGTTFTYVSDPNAPNLLTLADGSKLAFASDGKLRRMTATTGVGLSLNWSDGRLLSVTHSAGNDLQFHYTGAGYVRRIDGPGGRSVEYDYAGDRLVGVRSADGRTVRYEYGDTLNDPLGGTLDRIIDPDGRDRRFTYDAQGRFAGVAANGGALPTTISYGTEGQIAVQSPSGTSYVNRASHGLAGQAKDLTGAVSDFRYDATGNRVGATRAGRSWNGIGDEAGNLLQGTDTLGRTRGASYTSGLNRIDWFRDAKDHVLDYDYDLKGNVTRITYPDGTTETFAYDYWGGVTSKKNRRGQTTSYDYNADGLLVSAVAPDESLGYGYDARGNMTYASSNRTGSIVMRYDARDFLTRIEYPGGKWFEFEHDPMGRRTARTGSDSPALSYTYDAVGRLSRIEADGALLVEYGYDDAGRLALETRGNGTSTSTAYDPAGRPLEIRHRRGSTLVASYIYGGYDAFGNPATITTPAGIWRYQYDATNQLIGVTPPGGTSAATQYDAEGNRISVGGVGYTTNALNQYTSAGLETFTYDSDGNMKTRTSAGATTTYSWNAAGQLVGVAKPNGDVLEYGYDALGNRSRVVKNGVTTTMVYDGDNLAAEYGADATLTTRYLYGAGLVAQQTADTVGYYGFDATGHTRLLTSADGSVLNRYEVKPFGGFTEFSETIPNRFRYVGRYGVTEDESGLFHMRARDYDSGLGRFVSADPVGLSGKDSSFYRYVSNQPVTHIDPSGLIEWGIGANPNWTQATLAATKLVALTATGVVGTPIGFYFAADSFYGFLAAIDNPYLRRELGVPGNGSIPGSFAEAATFRFLKEVEFGNAEAALLGTEWIFEWSNLHDKLDKVFSATPAVADTLGNHIGAKDSLDRKDTDVRTSFDPNEKLGPVGFGPERWIVSGEEVVYTVKFENLASPAGGPARGDAQVISVTDVLDPDIDLSSIELLDMTLGDQTIADFTGLQNGTIRVPRYRSNLLMDVAAKFELGARKLTWTFTAVDPLTGRLPDLAGILPPNDGDTGRGEGYVKFRARLIRGLPNRTSLTNSASIVFDDNAPILTNRWSNLTDGVAPTSTANVVSPISGTSRPTIAWKGSDGDGSGIESYDIYVRPQGGTWRIWLSGTTKTSSVYISEARGTYEFMSIARDRVGNVEAKPGLPERTVKIP